MGTVSVIIPVYNVEKYVARCIQSVMNQTYDNKFIECVIVDDCGTDHSMKVVHDLIDNYTGDIKFQIVSHEINSGISETRNSGLRAATGDFILFVDSDDYITADCISVLMEATNQYQSDITIGNCFNHASKSYHHTTKEVLSESKQEFQKDIYNLYYAAFPWNKLIRRKFLLENNLFFTKGIIFEDTLWLLQVSKYVKTVVYLPNNTYSYECNPTSIMSNIKKDMNPAGKSFMVIVDYAIKLEDERFQTEIDLFVFHFIMEAFDCLWKHKVQSINPQKLYTYRQNLLRRVLLHRKYLLATCFLLSYRPLWYITLTRIYRNHRVDWRLRIRDYYNRKQGILTPTK